MGKVKAEKSSSQSSQSGRGGGAGKAKVAKQEQLSRKDKEQKVKEVLRYVLFKSSGGSIVKYKDIKDEAMHPFEGHMSDVMESVEHRLKKVFGMTLTELPDLKQEALATQMDVEVKPPNAKSAKSFVLLNALPGQQRQALSSESKDTSIFGLLMIILAFLYVKSMEATEKQLHSFLKDLGVNAKNKLKCFGSGDDDLSAILNDFIRQKYIWKGQAKESLSDTRQNLFRWGARAWAELSEDDIVSFIAEVYGESPNEWLNQMQAIKDLKQSAMEKASQPSQASQS